MAQDDELAKLFRAALDDETKGARSTARPAPRPRPGLGPEASETTDGGPSRPSGPAPPRRVPGPAAVPPEFSDARGTGSRAAAPARAPDPTRAPPRPAPSTRPAPYDEDAAGIVAIPRSEAHTLGRVKAIDPTAPRRDAGALRSAGTDEATPIPPSQRAQPPSGPVSIAPTSRRPGTAPIPVPPSLRGGNPTGPVAPSLQAPSTRPAPNASVPPMERTADLETMPLRGDGPITGRVRTSEVPRNGVTPSGSEPLARGKTSAADIRGTPAKELTLPPEAMIEQLDHKGRSKPLYAPRTQRPVAKRARRDVELLLGLFPGARHLARENVARGLAIVAVGIVSLLPTALVLGSWSQRVAAVQALELAPSWLAIQAGAAVLSLAIFEFVRAMSSDPTERARIPLARYLAALLLPALVTVVAGPLVASHGAAVVEPFWFIAWVCLIVGVLGTSECLGQALDRDQPHLLTMWCAGLVGFGGLAVLLALALSPELNLAVTAQLTQFGFEDAPRLVKALHLPI